MRNVDFDSLPPQDGDGSVLCYLPIHRTGREVRQSPIRFPPRRGCQAPRERGRGAVDLIDEAACETLLHGGRAFCVDADAFPRDMGVCALLRH